MSKKRLIEVLFRGERYQVSPKTAAELDRRGFLDRRVTPYRVANEPYLTIRNEQ